MRIKAQGKDKSWCAEIPALCKKFGFKREFIKKVASEGDFWYEINREGIYEISIESQKFYAYYDSKTDSVKSMTPQTVKQWFERRATVYTNEEYNEVGIDREAGYPVLFKELKEKDNLFNSAFFIKVEGNAADNELKLIFDLEKILNKRKVVK